MAIVPVVVLLLVVAFARATTPDVVNLPTGVIQGVRLEKSRFFKGVPYAAPPLAENRWRAPQPHAPWPGMEPKQL